MDNLIELNELLLEVIIQYMDATGPAELSLLDVLTDACMEIEDYLGKHNTKDIIQHQFILIINNGMDTFFKLVTDLGFPIAAACACGYFVFLTMKFILANVMSSVKNLSNIITALNTRVKVMNNDIIRIDTLVSNALGVKPDVDRIARADGKDDARID